MNQLAEQWLEDRAKCRQVMVVRDSSTVRHGRQLITVGIKELLKRLLCTHLGPLSIWLVGKVVKVAEVTYLGGR